MSHEKERSEGWREALDDEERGRSMRALCRAVFDERMILGGAWDRVLLEAEVIEHVQAGRYGEAAAFLSVLCLMTETGGFCPSCSMILKAGRCPRCDEPVDMAGAHD